MFRLDLIFKEFWRQHPALLYGLVALLGVSFALNGNPCFLIPLFTIILPLFIGMRRRLLFVLLIGLGSYLYTQELCRFQEMPQEGIKGKAEIEISSVTTATTHFGKKWLYKGKIKGFVPDFIPLLSPPIIVRNVPCVISLAQDDEIHRPPANCSYTLQGRLKQSMPGSYGFVVGKHEPWYPIEGSWSLAEYRYWAKQQVTRYIQDHISEQRAAIFLAGIATGNFDDRLMIYEFSRFGVQHIMAISGFHFAIIAGILSVLLRFMMPAKKATALLIFLLSSYFLFLGCSPSVMRAWITALVLLGGILIERRGSGLNSIGIALLAILIYDPLSSQNLGFAFSFVTTASILLLYEISDSVLQKVFAKRLLSQMIEMDLLNQHGYCVLALFRQALALTVAVNLVALPMTLFYFHKFPLMSLVYNIFFPFLVSISMLLLIFGMLLTLIYPLADAMHFINTQYTQFVLNFTYQMPTSFDVVWRISSFSLEFLIIYMTGIFVLSIFARYYLETKRQSVQDWAFV